MQPSVAIVFSELRNWLAWAPDWVNGVALLALAVVAALGIDTAAVAVLRRAIPARHTFLRLLLERTRGPTRLALMIFLAGAAISVAPFEPEIKEALRHALLIAFVLLLGWAALAVTQLVANLYLRRFQLEAGDSLSARKLRTQIGILERAVVTLIVIFSLAGVLMTFEPVRQYGLSIFASAGVAGIIVGLAARPVLSNLFAGLQIAIAQPIRIDDVVVVDKQQGRIEEITATYVVVRLWDLRRLIVPLSHFIEKPFENWTRETTALLAPIVLHLDYAAPLEQLRAKVDEIAAQSPLWDQATKSVQVIDTTPEGIQVRIVLSARNSAEQWNLQCDLREKLIAFLQREHPEALRRQRTAGQGAKGKEEEEAAAAAATTGE